MKFEMEQFLEMVQFDRQMFIDKFEDEQITVDTVVNLLDIYIEDIKELIEDMED